MANRYSVPLGTYQPNSSNIVYIDIEDEQLFIKKSPEGDPLAIHTLSHGKGKLIKNTHHSRDRSKGIAAYMDTVKKSFKDENAIHLFLEELYQRYPRYIRDQLQILQRATKDYEPFIQQALDICTQENLWSANDFHDVVKHLARVEENNVSYSDDEITPVSIPPSLLKQKAELRDIDGYLKILGGA
ncbi:hypothetical protein [Pontibacillus sp. HMF3514]|uniref:hypothetical protein n=1 Tax=Pontibacillus sp. HMF3514 TaxID=2692425 RepID=UPI0013201BA3|nr:hypothetical protein [Pontibacillus sp. HMF3514]QHE52817.1 hypothetical protein GS400_12640 [Pontibacillus sp. HMF3514]